LDVADLLLLNDLTINKTMAVLLKNATYIDWKTIEFSQRNILTGPDSNPIQFIDNIDQLTDKNDLEVLDCSGKLVTKSFAVGHHHAYSALSRGMRAPKIKPENFYDILRYIWWTLDKCLDPEIIEASALVTAIACAKAGATFVIDHHASPFAVKGSLGLIAKAFDRIGISHLLCYEISDRDGLNISKEGLEETESYLQKHQGLIGLHASFTVGNHTLYQAVDMMNHFNSGIHIHTAEDLYDQDFCLRKYGKRVVERLYESGALKSSKTILAHCIHLDENEKDIIRNSPCWIVQNAESNMNNNVGHFNSEYLGSNIMSGTDGMHSDMLRSIKAAFFEGQGSDSLSCQTAYNRFRNVHRYLNENNYTGDGRNNLVVLDYDTPTEINRDNFHGHFIWGIDSNHIRDVISGGKLIVKNRQIVTVNESEILEMSREHAGRLWKKMENFPA
jgi:cytosine/adenosine deaminase-related metal-dependent hydrolase